MKKIAEFYTIEVYAIDKSDTIILYYHGGDVSYPPTTLRMNIYRRSRRRYNRIIYNAYFKRMV